VDLVQKSDSVLLTLCVVRILLSRRPNIHNGVDVNAAIDGRGECYEALY